MVACLGWDVVHCIIQNQDRYFAQISIFWAGWGEQPLAVSSLGGYGLPPGYRMGGGAAGEAPRTRGLAAGHQGTGPSGTSSHTERPDPSITRGSVGRPSGTGWTPNLLDPTLPIFQRRTSEGDSFLTPSCVPRWAGGACKLAFSASTFLFTDKSVLTLPLTNPNETDSWHECSSRDSSHKYGLSRPPGIRHLSEVRC